MHILHIALGGCLSAAPVRYGLTEDTGGHIAFVLGASAAQAARPDVEQVTIVTRAFDTPDLGPSYGLREEPLGPRRRILRLRTAETRYLEKTELEAEIPALTEAFLDEIADGLRPDVIHAHFADAAVLARAAKARFGIPWVFSSHSLGLDKDALGGGGNNRRVERERAAIRDASVIVASSRDEAERQIPVYDRTAEGRTSRVNPGISLSKASDPATADAILAPWLREPGKPIILAIARPVAKKNLAVLIEAFAASPALRMRANLVILAGLRGAIGDTSNETARVVTDLFDRVDRHGLWGRVALPREHGPADVRALYDLAAANGVFVNPAKVEPFGLTVVEAIQCGVPVVATRHGGPPDIIAQAGYGRLIEPGNLGEIAAACLASLSDPDRVARTRAAADRSRRAFCWTSWAEAVDSLYRRMTETFPTQDRRPGQLVVSDMDATLTGDRGAAQALTARLSRPGAPRLVVATGRSVTEARRILSKWNLPEPTHLITSVGSEVWLRNGNGAYRPDDTFSALISDGWQHRKVRDVAVACGLSCQADYEQRAFKVSLFGGPDDARRLIARLEAADVAARVVASHGRFIDVLPARAGKAAAAAHVAASMGLGAADCLAAGDSGNDRDLLEWAGSAVIPTNALPELDDLESPTIRRSDQAHAGAILDALDVWSAPERLVAAE